MVAVKDSPRGSLAVASLRPVLTEVVASVVLTETSPLSSAAGDVTSITDDGVVCTTAALEEDPLPSEPPSSGVVGAAVIRPGRLRLLKNDKSAARSTSLGVMLLMLIKPLKPLKSPKIVFMSSAEGVGGRTVVEESTSKSKSKSSLVSETQQA